MCEGVCVREIRNIKSKQTTELHVAKVKLENFLNNEPFLTLSFLTFKNVFRGSFSFDWSSYVYTLTCLMLESLEAHQPPRLKS